MDGMKFELYSTGFMVAHDTLLFQINVIFLDQTYYSVCCAVSTCGANEDGLRMIILLDLMKSTEVLQALDMCQCSDVF